MRNIKFKAFDKKNKQMMDVKKIDFAYNEDGTMDEELTFVHFTDGSFTTLKWVNLREFTEHKDKDCVEVYDGDVLKSSSGLLLTQWTNKNYSEKWGYGLVNAGGNEDTFHYGTCKEDFSLRQVVGNIYEHPELLSQLQE